MTSKLTRIALLTSLTVLAGAACVSPVLMTAASTPIEGRAYQVVGETSGETCMASILGIPIATDASLHTALARARTKVAADALIDIVVDSRYVYTFFYNRSCTVVHARGIKFAPPQAKPPKPTQPEPPPPPVVKEPPKPPVTPAPPVKPAKPAKPVKVKKTKKQLAAERREAAAAKKKAVAEAKKAAAARKKAEAEAKKNAAKEKQAMELARRKAEEEAKPIPEAYSVFCKYKTGDPIRVETKAKAIEAEFVKCVHFGVRIKKPDQGVGVVPFGQIWNIRKATPKTPAEAQPEPDMKTPAQPSRTPAKPAQPGR